MGFFCVLSSFQLFVRAFFIHFAIPKLDGLLEMVAEAGNCRDQRNLLILEVQEDAGSWVFVNFLSDVDGGEVDL